jgi:hypothetical protein
VPQPEPRRRNAGLIVLVVALILVLGGGGGYAAYRFLTQPKTPVGHGPTTATTTTTAVSTPTTPAVFPYTVKVGDCVYNAGTDKNPMLQASDCSRAGSFKVVRIQAGPNIPRAADGSFDRDTTASSVCKGIVYQTWYGYQTGTPELDLFFCMTNNG